MGEIQNFLLLTRTNTSSNLEKCADFLLTPARVLWGGKHITVFSGSVHVSNQQEAPSNFPSWTKIAFKVAALFFIPFALIGALIKLICLRDVNYRAFCAQEIPANSTCHPKLFEMYQHVHSTRGFTNDNYVGRVIFKPLDLSECSCGATGAFHRFRSPRRENLENAIVQRLIETKQDKTEPLHLLSMGSGGLMSDFLILEKLVLAGFKELSIDCVDPTGIDPAQVGRIQEFFASYPDAKVQIQAHRTIDAVPADKTGYSALLAVDYDTLASWDFHAKFSSAGDLMKAYRRLDAGGFMGLGWSNEDTLYGPHTPLTHLFSNSSAIFSLADDLAQQLAEKEELTIGISHLHLGAASHVLFLALAMAAEKSGKDYQKISVSALTQKSKDIKPDFQAMMQSLFPRAAIEITFHEEQNKKCDVLFTGTLENEFKSKEYLSLLLPQALTYILEPRGGIQRQNDSLENQRVQVK